jgi:endonuclease/exonuclease/phosphatase family metal-dependent hydrolase
VGATLKILTINIWNRQGPWEARRALLKAGIEALAPDVVGVQEVMSDGSHTLAHEIGDGYEVAFGVARPLSGGIAFGNAVMSRFPITKSEVVPLPNADTDESRSMLMCELQTPEGPLPFCCTHLAWKFHHGYVREQQVLALARAIKDKLPIRGDVLPAILTGDFNARPDATEIRFLGGRHALEGTSTYLADCFEEVGEGPGYTYDARNNPYAALTAEAPRRIDYVFARGPDEHHRGRPLSARVVLDRVEDGVAPSDHYGVLAEIAM